MKYNKLFFIMCKDRPTAEEIRNKIRFSGFSVRVEPVECPEYRIAYKEYKYFVWFTCTCDVRDLIIEELSKNYNLVNESRKEMWACN